jgi:beta-lactamase class A
MTRSGRRLALLIALVVMAACTDDDRPAASSASSSSPPITSTTTTLVTTTTSTVAPDALQVVVDDFVNGQTVRFSVVAVDLATGARAEHLAGRQVRSASLYKLFVARELLRRVHAGRLDRAAPANDGQGRTVDQCIHDMIVVSDNACGVAGLNIVGRGAQDAGLHRDGFVSTSLASPQMTSAADVALFFTAARDGSLLGPGGESATAELYGLLRQQQVNDRLPTALPAGTPIAHKTGDIREWAHDAGVITTPRGDVLLAVLSGPWPLPCCDADHPGEAERVAFGAIAELGSRVYDVLA